MADIDVIVLDRGCRRIPKDPEFLEEGRINVPAQRYALGMADNRTGLKSVPLARRGDRDGSCAFEDDHGFIA
jgi:hypothetical protein